MATETTKLVVRLPADLHRRLQEKATAHTRSLNGEIVSALRHYVEGVHEIRIIWDEDDEAAAREWEALAGETLDESSGDEGWEFTTEERQAVTGLLERGT